jgi:hypothetical protein
VDEGTRIPNLEFRVRGLRQSLAKKQKRMRRAHVDMDVLPPQACGEKEWFSNSVPSHPLRLTEQKKSYFTCKERIGTLSSEQRCPDEYDPKGERQEAKKLWRNRGLNPGPSRCCATDGYANSTRYHCAISPDDVSPFLSRVMIYCSKAGSRTAWRLR